MSFTHKQFTPDAWNASTRSKGTGVPDSVNCTGHPKRVRPNSVSLSSRNRAGPNLVPDRIRSVCRPEIGPGRIWNSVGGFRDYPLGGSACRTCLLSAQYLTVQSILNRSVAVVTSTGPNHTASSYYSHFFCIRSSFRLRRPSESQKPSAYCSQPQSSFSHLPTLQNFFLLLSKSVDKITPLSRW